jgi:hypothetical protein
VPDAKGLSTMGRMMASGNGGFQPGDLGLSMTTLAKTAPMRSVHGIQGALYLPPSRSPSPSPSPAPSAAPAPSASAAP